jgi:hypothetical protein
MQPHLELGETEARLAIDTSAAEFKRRKNEGSSPLLTGMAS